MKPLFMKSKKELKKKLHKLIDSIDDKQVLNILNEDIAPYATKKRAGADNDDDLTAEQLKELQEAIAEIDRGETISWEEFKKELREWRSK